VQVHRAYFAPTSTAASVAPVTPLWPPPGIAGAPAEFFFVKVTNLSPNRQIVVTHTWVTSLDKVDEVQILNPLRPLPSRLGHDDQYETWVSVNEVPDPELGAEWRFRVQLSSGKVVKSKPNKKVPASGYVAAGGETAYSAPLTTAEPFGVTGINPEVFNRGSINGPSATEDDTTTGGQRRTLSHVHR
jgi:hypothetical protein